MKIAMFGGSFNPIHIGHMKLVEASINEYELDKVIIMPTYHTPLKDNSQFADSGDRLNMCRIAFAGNSKVEVSDMEIKRQGTSYTYITLSSLKELYPEDELFLIVGADMFLSIQNWKNPEEIFKLAGIIAVPRECKDKELVEHSLILSKLGCRAYIMKHDIMKISSTEIRNAIKSGVDSHKFLSEGVYKYIKAHRLYGA